MRPTIPPEKRQTAVQYFEKGLGYKRTAGLIGVQTSTVRDWKRLWQAKRFTLAPAFQYKGKLSPEEKRRILELRRIGENIEVIARQIDRSANMVALFLRQTLTKAVISSNR